MNKLRFSPFLLLFLAPACITAARPAGEGGEASSSSGVSGGELLLLDDFEGSSSRAGQPWSASADSNNLGSVATYAVEDGGKVGKGAHFTGKLGRNVKPCG